MNVEGNYDDVFSMMSSSFCCHGVHRKDLISESEGLGILSRVVQLKSEGKGLEWRYANE